jgi:hypothetical protein
MLFYVTKRKFKTVCFLLMIFIFLNSIIQFIYKYSINSDQNLAARNHLKSPTRKQQIKNGSKKSFEIKKEKGNSMNKREPFEIRDRKSNSELDFIFIGGYPGSGTNLMVFSSSSLFISKFFISFLEIESCSRRSSKHKMWS